LTSWFATSAIVAFAVAYWSFEAIEFLSVALLASAGNV
jgi:hypothetical protein